MRRMRHVLAATAFAALGNARGVCPGASAACRRQPLQARPGRGAATGGASLVLHHECRQGRRRQLRRHRRSRCLLRADGERLAASRRRAGRTWRAYLSQPAAGGQPAVNARDRIGAGPWFNARGQLIANNVADLHGDVQRDRNSINKNFALNEKAGRSTASATCRISTTS